MEKELKIKNIPIEKIIVDLNQPRKNFKGISELSRSIKKEGLIQPLEVEKQKDRGGILGEMKSQLNVKTNY